MSPFSSIHTQVSIIRWARSIHKWTGISLFLFFIFIAISGILLGWKKNSNGLILPVTQESTSNNQMDWLSLPQIMDAARISILQHTSQVQDSIVDRIDVRPDKGIAKVTFEHNYYGVQVDLTSGKVLQIAYRYSDVLEDIHDGSIVDNSIGTGGYFKLLYTSTLSIALWTFILTGIWLFFGPKYIRYLKRKS